MKTQEEITILKQQWESDPVWDIETTEGFREHEDELLQYRLEVERKQAQREADRVLHLCLEYSCNKELLKVIESMQRRIDYLELQGGD